MSYCVCRSWNYSFRAAFDHLMMTLYNSQSNNFQRTVVVKIAHSNSLLIRAHLKNNWCQIDISGLVSSDTMKSASTLLGKRRLHHSPKYIPGKYILSGFRFPSNNCKENSYQDIRSRITSICWNHVHTDVKQIKANFS